MENVFIMDHPLIQHKISMLRNKNTGTNEFRKLIEEIAVLMGYEALRDLPLEDVEIETPIEKCKSPMIVRKKPRLPPVPPAPMIAYFISQNSPFLKESAPHILRSRLDHYIFFAQMSSRQHLSQYGFVLAVHTSRPWYTRRWQKSLPSSGGMIFHRAISTFFGSLIPSTSPIRLQSRMQCVSVTIAGLPKTSPMIRLALLRPTPGSFKSASKVVGMLSSYCS